MIDRGGEAQLSLRVWSGKPYKSTPVEVFQLNKTDGIGLQKLQIIPQYEYEYDDQRCFKFQVGTKEVSIAELATYDGLNLQDFKDWFKIEAMQDPFEPMAVIQLSKFRY